MINSKKADLSLSTNAIVILILAITILGLGLTFVRGLFKQAESKITEVTSSTELTNPPTRDNPMTAVPGELTIRKKDTGKILVAFLNTGPGRKDCTLSSSPITGGAKLIMSGGKVNIDQDKINLWTIAVDPSAATLTDPQVHRLEMKCPTDIEATKDIIITVAS